MDGQVDEIRVYSYDNTGLNILTETDENADGLVDKCSYQSYDEITREWIVESDAGCDGTIERIQIITYDENGNWTKLELDNDGDGEWDSVSAWTYDEYGNEQTHTIDSEGDGVWDFCSVYIYDQEGRLSRIEWTNCIDDIVTSSTNFEYVDCNESVYTFRDNDEDGVEDWCDLTIYNQRGLKIRWEIDLNCDSVGDTIEAYSYDEFGNMIRQHRNTGLLLTWTFDDKGNKLTHEIDFGDDGVTDVIWNYTYDCWN